MTYSADRGYGSGPQASHDHDSEFSIECETCVQEWIEDEALRWIALGFSMGESFKKAAAELDALYGEV